MAVDPLMAQWLAAQGQGQSPPFMQQTPFPNRLGGVAPAPAPPPAMTGPGGGMGGPPLSAGGPPPPVQMPGRMTPQNPTGGLPRPIIQPKNDALFGTYTSTYQRGRQMGQEPVVPEQQSAQPFYLDNAGNTTAPTGQVQPQPMPQPLSPADQWMADRFPRSVSLAQQLSQVQGMQTMAPQLEADMAQQKADTELSLMREKGALEQEAMRRKFKNTEMQMQQQERKTQMQMQQEAQRAQQQQMQVTQPRPPMGGRY